MIIKTAKALLEKGYSVIPVTKNKIPAIPQWFSYQTSPMKVEEVDKLFAGVKNVALLTGTQKGVFCIDIDLKYDLSGTLFDRLKEAIPKQILKKAYVQKTQSGGYHLVFRTNPTTLKGNEKWASRHTTAYEQHQTYMHNFQREDTRDKALKIASSDRTRVLIETRAIGGYFLIAPSENYEYVFGKITEISKEEYEQLETTCRSFNEVFVKEKKQFDGGGWWKVTPFEDYFERGDVLELLEDHGWSVSFERGEEVRLKRPGNTATKDSAIFHRDTKVFNCFSTSTTFDTSKAYTPAMIFAELECEGDLSEAFYKLVELGFGVKG
jgi:hypothetical protein